MAIFTFKGGVHPDDGKKLTMNKEIEEYIPKGDMVYPLNQHIGAPAVPVVKKGDRVLVGEKIAEAGGFISANIHSSVSGKVIAIEPRLTVNGNKVESIVIENDNLYEEIDYSLNTKPLEEMYREDVIEVIKEAGIVGMGGAGFPTHVKLSPKNEQDIDTIIVNGAECEPYLTSDYRRMIEEPEKIIVGLKIIINLFENAVGIIAVEDNKPKAIKKLREMLKNEKNITLNVMKTKYPQGAERQLIYANTGRYINSKMLPADAGCIVQNVDTVISIYEAVIMGRPLISRVVTVSGDCIQEPKNYIVRIGTNMRELVEASGGFSVDPGKTIVGGPMMGKALYSLEVPVTKGTSALIAFKNDEVSENETGNCIKCGRCINACPSHVMPYKLMNLADAGKMEEFVENDGMECCECGCCSYICPAKRPLTQTIASARKRVLAKGKK